MKHRVSRTVRDLRDVDDFLELTKRFSKKFYTVDLVGGESVRYQLNVRATAISRDLVYNLKWMMDAKSRKSDEHNHTMVRDGDAPIFGWIPLKEKELKKFYPNVAHVPDEPGEHHWIDLFECWDFKLVDKIDEID